jgi:hypothetical protein
MMYLSQRRDPLTGVLDYILEVGSLISFSVTRLSLAPLQRNAQMILWPLPMMMTFSWLKRWYVWV